MKWTEAQNEAIIERDKNLLVAAAAGSGKTAVLVERIKKLVIDEKISIDSFLILTFTNAAASEMKEKIVKAINLEIFKNNENRAFLKKQLSVLNSANISTFHAFAQEVIRRFFQIIGLDPSLKVCDEAEQTILKNKAMDELFLEEFEKNSDDFIALLNAYASSKNENAVKTMISDLSSKMESLIEPKRWIDDVIENLNLVNTEFEDTLLAKTALASVEQDLVKISYILQKLLDIFEQTELREGTKLTFELLDDVKEAEESSRTGNFNITKENIENMDFFDLTQKRFGKENKTEIDSAKELGAGIYLKKAKELQKKIVERLAAASSEIMKMEMTATYAYAQTLVRLVLKYYQNYSELKLEKKLMDFTDIERYAIKILEHEEVANVYRDKFEYIFIDEYQDSNPVQEKLIGLIKRENNVFMVGDVKQSIYKFRQAEPKLFEDKYKSFRDGDSIFSKKIDLNANFRSKKPVIDSVNSVFEVLMGEAYDEDAKLNVGVKYDGEHQYRTEVHVIEDKGSSAEIDDEQEEFLEEFDKYEKEASIIANIINKTVGNKIYDVKSGCVRAIELKDIVVLLRNARGVGEKFQKTFETYGIPSYISDSEGYFDTLEIQIIINFLKVIDNRRNDIPLISVLTSGIFEFSYEEIAKIRILSPDGSFFDAFLNYSEQNEKAAIVLKKLDEWAKLSAIIPIADFIWKIMSESGYYLYVSALPKGEQRQANLRMLLEKAKDFQDMNIRGLHEFLDYVDVLKAKSVRIGQVSTVSEEDNVLRIMTIHKSKGLEFPVVIVAALGREWKNRRDSSGLVFNKDMGFAFEFSDPGKHYKRKTAWQNEIIRQNENEALEEEKRILYVAFTRAQDKLVLVGTKKVKDEDEEKSEAELDISKLEIPKTYLDMVLSALEASPHVQKIKHGYEEIALSEKDRSEKVSKKFEILEKVESGNVENVGGKLYDDIGKRLGFKYDYSQGVALKSKFSVSELNEDAADDAIDEITLNEPNFGFVDESELIKANRGTICHTFLEHWNFRYAPRGIDESDSALRDYGNNLIAALKEKNILLENEAEICAGFLDSVIWLSKSELGKRMAKADVLKKEASFIMDKEIEGQAVILQGTVDCYFEDEKGLVLLDYKTGKHGHVSETVLKDRYRKQIDLYKEALSEAFAKPVFEAYLVFIEDRRVIPM